MIKDIESSYTKIMKSREEKFLFDNNEYILSKIGVKLSYRTSIYYDGEGNIIVVEEDKLGQRATFTICLDDHKTNLEEVIMDIWKIEENYNLEVMKTKDDIIEFYKSVN